MKNSTLICLSLFAVGGLSATWFAFGGGAAPVVEATPAGNDDTRAIGQDGSFACLRQGEVVAEVKKSHAHSGMDWYDIEFTPDGQGKGFLVKDAKEELDVIRTAARHLAKRHQGNPFTLYVGRPHAPWAWLPLFLDDCKRVKSPEDEQASPDYPYRMERVILRSHLCRMLKDCVPGISLDNFQVAADDFYISKDYAGAAVDIRMRFNTPQPALPTDGLFSWADDGGLLELVYIYGGARRDMESAWGVQKLRRYPSYTWQYAYDWPLTILMQRLKAIEVVKTQTPYLVYYDEGKGFYLYPVTGKLPASEEEVRTGSLHITKEEMRQRVAEALKLMGGAEKVIGPPFLCDPDGKSRGDQGVDWDALTPGNVNAHYVFRPYIVAGETDYPIIHAVKEGSVEHVRKCIAMGADLTVRCKENEVDYDTGMRPLQIAARHGHTEIVKLLVEAGADMEHRSWSGSMTPLMFAAKEGYVDTVRCLLEAGANPARRRSDPGKDSSLGFERLERPDAPLVPSSDPDTALEFAERNNHPECAELIRRYLPAGSREDK